MTIDEAFNASIEYYDDWMKKALPNYEDLFRTAQELIPFPPVQAIDVLDLGAGTGLFSRHILEKYPQSNVRTFENPEKNIVFALPKI